MFEKITVISRQAHLYMILARKTCLFPDDYFANGRSRSRPRTNWMKMSPICRHSGSIGEERKLPTRRIALQSEQTVSAGNERAVEEISAAVVACSGFKIHRILIQRRKKEDEGRRCVEAFIVAAGPVGTTSARHADAVSARHRITKSPLCPPHDMTTTDDQRRRFVPRHHGRKARANDAQFVILHDGAEEREPCIKQRHGRVRTLETGEGDETSSNV